MSSHKHLIPIIRSLLAASIVFTLSTELAEHIQQGNDYQAISIIFLSSGGCLIFFAITVTIHHCINGLLSCDCVFIMAIFSSFISLTTAIIMLYAPLTPNIRLSTFILKLSSIGIECCTLAAQFQKAGQLNMVEKIEEEIIRTRSNRNISEAKIQSGEILTNFSVDQLYNLI